MGRAIPPARAAVRASPRVRIRYVRDVWHRPDSWCIPAAGLDQCRRTGFGCVPGFTVIRTGGKSRGAVERTLASFVDAMEHAFYSEQIAKEKGLLQKLDPRL